MSSNTIVKLLVGIGALILISIISLIVKLPYHISMPGKIYAASEWVVYKGNNGQLITQLNNRRTGIVKNYSIREFERGDDVSFTMLPHFTMGASINEADTIGYIFSNEIQRQIILLKGQLNVARANLELNVSGEKESIINEAKENLAFQTRKAEEQKKILGRKKALYESNLISQEEYEIAAGTAALNEIEIGIAEAQLKSAQSGAKNQQVDLIKQQINSYENEIAIWQNRLKDDKLVSPISGVVNQMTMGDTLFIISDTSSFIVLLPIKLQEKNYIKVDDLITIESPFLKNKIEAKLKVIGNSVHYLTKTPVVYGKAFIRVKDKSLLTDMLARCTIECGYITIFEHVKRMMNHNLF